MCTWTRWKSTTHERCPGRHLPARARLGSDYGLDPLDAYQLITQTVESPLANVCDPNYTSVAKLAKQYMPQAPAMDGGHARLSDLAATYRGA